MSNKKNDSEEKKLNNWISIGLLSGTVIGMVLCFMLDNIIYLGISSVVGLLLGTLVGEVNNKAKKR